MRDEIKGVLERLTGYGFSSLRQRVLDAREEMGKGVYTIHVETGRECDSTLIARGYSALMDNALVLFSTIDALAVEVREQRERPVEVEEIGGVKVYASGRLARQLNEAKDTVQHQQAEIDNLRAALAKAEKDAAESKALADAWKRERDRDQALIVNLVGQIKAVKKAVSE